MPAASPHHDPWERHEGFDLWSIPHFLFGALMGALPSYLGISPMAAIALSGVLAVGWEIGERAYGVEESARNVAVDILLAIAACALIALALSRYPMPRPALGALTGLMLLIFGAVSFSGWRAYRRRARAGSASHPQE